MNNMQLRFRQIHLDFHTSPDIPDVGEHFDKNEFVKTLKDAHVDSVTCFARCHHGMLYYDSKKFPERIHPQLKEKRMLEDIIEACHAEGIKVPVYITIQWDHFTAKQHPDWIAADSHGKPWGTEPYEAGFYQVLCVNTPYRDFLKEQIAELFQAMDVDGLFMDIVYPTECNCRYCREKMDGAGIDVSDASERMRYAETMIDEFKEDISAYIRSFRSDASIFYNTSHIGVKQRSVKDAYTHFELESLPGGNWGYIHFPVTMRYARTLGLDCLSHTGKFHLEWGDFHSFKNQAALEYECFRMLALGSKCLIGDQMEPCGMLSKPVYELIGKVYGRVKEVETWCENAVPVVDLAVLSPEEYTGGNRNNLADCIMGLENMFDQLGYQFDIVDSHGDFCKYPLLVLPDCITITEKLHGKLEQYLAQGGKLLATFESGLDVDKKEMKLTETGVTLLPPTRDLSGKLTRGILSTDNAFVDYILPNNTLGRNLPETEHVMYIRGTEIKAEDGTQVLMDFVKPYFDRDFRHFCSHRQTPSSGAAGNPAAVKKDNIVYFSSPVFTIYNARAPRWCKEIIKDAVEMLIGETQIRHGGPSTIFTAVNEQKEQCRKIVHFLHYIPQKICQDIHTLEDVIPLYQIPVSIKETRKVEHVSLVPGGSHLEFEQENGRVNFTVPEINGYQLAEIQYGGDDE